MLRVYLDNDVCSAISRRDHDKAEMDAVWQLLEWNRTGMIMLGASRHSLREMECAPPQYQDDLKKGLIGLEMAKDDHRVLGFSTLTDPYGGYTCNPLVTDIVNETLYSQLIGAGLRPDDAKQFMDAVHNRYDRFVTWDTNFLNRRIELERFCPSIRIQKPSELVDELRAAAGVRIS